MRPRLLAGPFLTLLAVAAVICVLGPVSPLLCAAVAAVLVFAAVLAPALLGAVRRGVRFAAGTIAAHAVTARDAAWELPGRLYRARPWLWVLYPAEHRARRKHGMARRHPERIACFYRKPRWRALERSLWPDREYVGYIEADMRERGWKRP
jgi:hypothetical protein